LVGSKGLWVFFRVGLRHYLHAGRFENPPRSIV
jgi:hypothetical protein